MSYKCAHCGITIIYGNKHSTFKNGERIECTGTEESSVKYLNGAKPMGIARIIENFIEPRYDEVFYEGIKWLNSL